MLFHPSTQYRALAPVGLTDRTWADAMLARARIRPNTDSSLDAGATCAE